VKVCKNWVCLPLILLFGTDLWQDILHTECKTKDKVIETAYFCMLLRQHIGLLRSIFIFTFTAVGSSIVTTILCVRLKNSVSFPYRDK